MVTPLLSTKLYIPSIQANLVSRPRLTERLSEGLHQGRKLTLVSAPAGYGKTTLVADWLHGTNRPLAWLSLDEGDNDVVRCFAYLVAALQRVDARQGAVGQTAQSLLEAPQTPSVESLVAALINDIDALATSPILVLDDYHTVTDRTVHQAIGLLLARQPPQMHLTIITRQDPPLPLSRLRARGQITEIRQSDLQFTPEEAATFLNRSTGVHLTAVAVATLAERTEGWVAGLQLAALSMQGRGTETIAQFIADFSGRHHFILDYLTDEVLQQQPRPVQGFLLQTSVLRQMCGPLCDAVLEIGKPAPIANPGFVDGAGESHRFADSSSQQILEHLHRANLFVVPLDDERRWYRYHRLFAELLQARLKETQPDLVPELHRRAAEWYDKDGQASEAVHHALATQDYAWAADLIEHVVNKITTWSRLDGVTYLNWLDALPDDVVLAKPRLRLLASQALFVTGQQEAAERDLRDLEHWLQNNPDAPDTVRLLELIAVDRASFAAVRGQISRAITYARRALVRLPEDDARARIRPASILGLALLHAGEVSEASLAVLQAIAAAKATGMSFAATPLVCNLADAQVIQGQLQQALLTCEQAAQMGTVDGKPIPAAGFARLGMGKILYERNDLHTAQHHVLEGIELLQQGGITVGLETAYATLARIRQALGDSEGASTAIRQALEIAQRNRISRLSTLVSAYQARLWLAWDRTVLAARWVQEYRQVGQVEHLRAFEDLTLARILLAEDRPAEALALLETLLPPAETAGRWGHVIEILVLYALAWQALGDTSEALDSLAQALELAEPEGYVRIFVGEGEPMATLLRRLKSRGPVQGYASKLLVLFSASEETGPQAYPLPELLTGRELEVLHLLAYGLTNAEIAERLFISLPTVKSHTRNIYGKLGVHSRRQAVAQAREFGILPPR